MPSPRLLYLVEGNGDMRTALELLLAYFGWEVRSFASSALCLEATLHQPPRCIVSELYPEDTNGIELRQALLSRGLAVPMVLLTTQFRTPLALSARSMGCGEVLDKLCDATNLAAAIERVVTAYRPCAPLG